MERRLTAKVQQHVTNFKNILIDKINNNANANELKHFISSYDMIEITPDDFIKRKRVKNNIAPCERCMAKRANGEQCSRRKLGQDKLFVEHI